MVSYFIFLIEKDFDSIGNKNLRILETAYQKLLKESRNYNTSPIYSNSFTLNTLKFSETVKNMTFIDKYRYSRILSLGNLGIFIVVNLVNFWI